MNIKTFRHLACLSILSATALTSAHAQQGVVFPDIKSSYLKTGDFVGPDHVLRVRPGMSKDQVRLELGNPHFNEGLFGVSEWDYAFNFYSGKGSEHVTCQFKVVYAHTDGSYRVASTHWKDPECALLVNPPAVAAVSNVSDSGPKKITLGTDGLFSFDGSKEGDLQPEGRERIRTLARDIRANFSAVKAVIVTGHTDRLGTSAYNEALSLARANTVRSLLASYGIAIEKIQAVGAGEKLPVITDCEGSQPTPRLIRCLQPNRRVEVEVVSDR